MSRTFVSTLPVLLLSLGVTPSVALAQAEGEPGQLSPYQYGPRQAGQGQSSPPAGTLEGLAGEQQREAKAPQELYQLRPGIYVYPAPYSPDYWSPRFRPYYDYGQHRQRVGARQRFSRPRHYGRRTGSRHRSYGGYSGYGGYGGYYGYNPYGDVHGAYEQGRYDANHDYLWYIASQRAGRLLNQHREMFDQAIILFRQGQYDRAAINLLGAADKNHASAASRLHAGHALFALRRYDEAVKLIARAFELSPGLPYKHYDLREEYGNQADFDRHLQNLKSYVARHPDQAGGITLLGYVVFYSEGPGAAHPYLEHAARLDRNSYFIPKLLKLARNASGMEKRPPAPQETVRPQQTRDRRMPAKPPIRHVRAASRR